jgi:2',3'-cyclic-nucleotide 2'-phosphodiesterase / 3'-nucleotidase
MKQLFAALLLALTFNSQAMAQPRTVKLRVIQTSDVHGSFFPYDFINRKPKAGTLARVSSYVNDLRKTYKDNVILLENGDILQGQPTCLARTRLPRLMSLPLWTSSIKIM